MFRCLEILQLFSCTSASTFHKFPSTQNQTDTDKTKSPGNNIDVALTLALDGAEWYEYASIAVEEASRVILKTPLPCLSTILMTASKRDFKSFLFRFVQGFTFDF